MPDDPGPEQRLERVRSGPLLDVAAPHPIRAMLITGWPPIVLALLLSYLAALFFPLLAAPLMIGVPLAVIAALTIGGARARRIRLTVTDENVRVSNGKAEIACARSHVVSAVLVERLSRRRLAPATTDLILLDRNGRSALLLSGLLWPPAVLDQVIAIVLPHAAVPDAVERVSGKQTPSSLTARFPRILDDADGTQRGRSARDIVLLVVMVVVAATCLVVSALLLFG